MKGFSIALNEWGVHAILYKGFADADPKAWIASLDEACGRSQKRGRFAGVFLDLRGLGDDRLSTAQTEALATLLTRMDVGRSALATSDPVMAKVLRSAAQKSKPSNGLRVFVMDGRDRLPIAAAYKWVLNATEPSVDLLAGTEKPAQGKIVPFAKPLSQPVVVLPVAKAVAVAGSTIRKAS